MSHTTCTLCWVIIFQMLPPFLRPRSQNWKKKKRSKHSASDGYVSDQVHAVHGPSTNLDAAGVSSFEYTLLQFSWLLQLIILFSAAFHINGGFASTAHSPLPRRLSLIGSLILQAAKRGEARGVAQGYRRVRSVLTSTQDGPSWLSRMWWCDFKKHF